MSTQGRLAFVRFRVKSELIMQNEPLVLGIAGLGGYAASIRAEIFANMAGERPAVKLAAVCDPDPALRAAAEG